VASISCIASVLLSSKCSSRCVLARALTFGEHFGNKSSSSWGYSVPPRLDHVRLRNEQHELYERSFQLVYCYSRHLRRDGWNADADDELVPFATCILTRGHRTLIMPRDCFPHQVPPQPQSDDLGVLSESGYVLSISRISTFFARANM
jgi:hypothetical protein